MTRQTTRLDCVGIGSFAQGIAVLNASARPYVYQLTDRARITIPANDGLVVEVRATHQSSAMITNEGK